VGCGILYQSSLAAEWVRTILDWIVADGRDAIVRFERSGPKVLLVQENLNFRAVSDDKDEKRAVHDSFAESVIWGSPLLAKRMAGCWWMRRIFTRAMRMAWRRR